MGIKIVKSNESIPVTNISMIIYGVPGIGKTSLAFTANKALLLDFDNGVKHIAERNKNDVIQIKTWKDIEDLTIDMLSPYDTIIVDTIGKMSDIIKADMLAKYPNYGKDNTPNQKGWGFLKQRIIGWKNMLLSSGKDIVYIGHVTEEKEGDNMVKKLKMEGKIKEEFQAEVDMIGYYSTVNNKRVLDFETTDLKTTKNRGEVPSLQEIKKDNKTFLGDLIELTKNNMNTKSEEMVKAEQEFQAILDSINALNTLEEFNSKLVDLKDAAPLHKQALLKAAADKGFTFNKDTKQFYLNDLPENI